MSDFSSKETSVLCTVIIGLPVYRGYKAPLCHFRICSLHLPSEGGGMDFCLFACFNFMDVETEA